MTYSQTWRSVFYLAAGLSGGVLILGLFSIDADVPYSNAHGEKEDRRVDWIGAWLITTGLVLIVFVLSDGEIVGWKTPCECPSPSLLYPCHRLLSCSVLAQLTLPRPQISSSSSSSAFSPQPLSSSGSGISSACTRKTPRAHSRRGGPRRR